MKGFYRMSKRKKKKNKMKRKHNMYVKNQKIINTTPVTPITPVGPDYWESDIECLSECGKAPKDMVVWIHPVAKEKIEILMEEYKSIEWLAYLLGEFGEKIEITDIFIPNQEITATSVDNIVCEEYNDLNSIGVIHSHHGMGNSFSGTDDTYINQNHDISLCISNSGIKGHVRWETPCGGYKIVECIVKVKTESLVNKDEFVTSIKEKIKKKTYTTTVVYQGGYPGYGEGYYASKPGGFVNRHVTPNIVNPKPKVDNSNLTAILTDEEIDEMDSQIEELDFDREQTVEEETALMKEMDELGTEWEDNCII